MARQTLEEHLHENEGPQTWDEIKANPGKAVVHELNLTLEIMSLYWEIEELEEKLAKMDEIISAQIADVDPDNS